jgi:hypothetical protein
VCGLPPRQAQFWGAHQRFFRQMLLAAKVPELAQMALHAVQNENMSVVIGLQSTGEAGITKVRARCQCVQRAHPTLLCEQRVDRGGGVHQS